MNSFQQLALIGSTASGKTALSIKLAKHYNAYILSIDSLSIYKEINIVSAKPTPIERNGIVHYGIDMLSPKDNFDVSIFIKLYDEVYKKCIGAHKNLIIVGGTSFYLKMLMEGISQLPPISQITKEKTEKYLQHIEKAYRFLYDLDSTYMSHIASKDSYRIEKALHIYFETHMTPSAYFKKYPPIPTIDKPLPIYQIVWDREILRKRITLRTQIMVNDGLIDEVCLLERTYGRSPNAMKSIGIKETLGYLDGVYDKNMLIEKITIHTARLAKRQNTFNNSQFENVIKGSVEALEKILL
jgi:tRNA dimethylallyltransferase